MVGAHDLGDLGPTGSAVGGAAITPSDDTDLDHSTRAIWVGTMGDLCVVLVKGDTVTLPNAVGEVRVAAKRVKATGTTATGLVGLW